MSLVGGRYRHGLRRLLPRATDEPGRAATPLELLFDLTFVASFAVAGTELAHGTAGGHGGTAAVAFTFTMLAVVWAWISVSWFSSAFDNDDWLFRLLTMVQMTGVIVLAIGLPPLFASIEAGGVLDNRVMVAGYVIIRLALVLQWIRAARGNPQYKPLALTYGLFVGVAQAGWVLIALFPVSAAAGLAAAVVLFAVEALGPIVAERKTTHLSGGSTPWHPHHLAERFALLTIIALGETVFGTLASSAQISHVQGWTVDAIVVIGVGITMSFGLWWTYFLLPHAAVLAARRDKAIPWAYGHILLFAAIAAVGAGLHVIGYGYDPEYDIDDSTVAASIAIPVIIFMIARYLLLAWLLSALPRDTGIQLTATAFPALAIILAAAGVPLWVSLLAVLAAPLSVILSFEVGGWRALDAQLARVISRPGRRDQGVPD